MGHSKLSNILFNNYFFLYSKKFIQKNKELNLNDPETFRDLSRPMGAINKNKLQKYKVFKIILIIFD